MRVTSEGRKRSNLCGQKGYNLVRDVQDYKRE